MSPIQPISPPSAIRPRAFERNAGPVFRDLLQTSTWFLLGGVAASLAFLVTRSAYVFVPLYLLLGWRTCETLLITAGWMKNKYLEGAINEKFTAQLPPVEGMEDTPGARGLCVFILGVKCNHPLGLLAPGMKEVGDWASKCYKEVETDYEKNGFLGATTWLSTDRSSGNEIRNMMYFKDTESLHRFAMGPAHRDTWNWWFPNAKKYPHIGIMHETYDVLPRSWEGVYMHMQPTGLGAASAQIETEDGQKLWWSTPVYANKGKLRSSRGRMDRTDGGDNERAGFAEYDL